MDIIFYVRWTIHYTVAFVVGSRIPHSLQAFGMMSYSGYDSICRMQRNRKGCVCVADWEMQLKSRVKFDRGLRQLTGYVSSETLPTDAAPELRRNVQHMLSYSCCEDSRPAGSRQWLTCSLERHWSVNCSGISPEEWLKLRSLLDSRYRQWWQIWVRCWRSLWWPVTWRQSHCWWWACVTFRHSTSEQPHAHAGLPLLAVYSHTHTQTASQLTNVIADSLLWQLQSSHSCRRGVA